ncbi:MAG: Rrf2 family transcriptional regulator [Patescibacteria group bacterium]
MFKIRKHVDYAIQLLVGLSAVSEGTVVSLQRFSKESTISFLFLQKIARDLRTAGMIHSVKGAGGGYVLSKPLEHISLLDVIHALEGSYAIAPCNVKGACCGKEKTCRIKNPMKRVNDRLMQEMQDIPISAFQDHL